MIELGTKIIFPKTDEIDGWGIVDKVQPPNRYHITFDDESESWYDENHEDAIRENYTLVPPNTFDDDLFTL